MLPSNEIGYYINNNERLEIATHNKMSSCGILDHIGIPAKGKGAMENWGLITYGEGYLVTEVASPPQEKIDAASVIAHELSHQVS